METLKDYAVDTNKLTLQDFLDRYKYQNNFFVRGYQTGLPKDKQAGFSFDCNEIHYIGFKSAYPSIHGTRTPQNVEKILEAAVECSLCLWKLLYQRTLQKSGYLPIQ